MVLYRGPSLLTGAEVVAIATGFKVRTLNEKTGDMIQAWVLRTDRPPMDAKRAGLDDAVCGDCELRGEGGYKSACYVAAWQGPHNVWKAWKAGLYPTATEPELAVKFAHEHVRLTAYGDVAAVPLAIWQGLLAKASGWTGYTHAWRRADVGFQAFCMASVTSPADRDEAQRAGWRTYRARGDFQALLEGNTGEVVCPASREAGHVSTCDQCQLCRGTANPAKSVAIIAHGKPGNLAAFYRTRPNFPKPAIPRSQ